MIRHLSAYKFTGSIQVAEALGGIIGYGYRPSETIAKARKIGIPMEGKGQSVSVSQDVVCSLKRYYVFGRQGIAAYLGRSTAHLSRDLKRYPGLKRIIRNPFGKFIYARRADLDFWSAALKVYRLKKSGSLEQYLRDADTSDAAISDERFEVLEGERTSLCPVCGKPITLE